MHQSNLQTKTPSKTDGNVPSHQGAPTTWLNGKFPRRIMSRHYWPVWGFLMARTQHSSFLEITSTLTTSITFFPATLSFHITSFTSPSQQKFACRTDILRNRFIGCPKMAGMVMLFLSTCFTWPEISYRQRRCAWAHVIFFGFDKIDEKW